MRISAQSTIAASERALEELAGASPEEPLTLPSNIRHLAGGAEVALAQVIITWAQRNPDANLQTYLQTSEQIDEFVRRLPGLVASLCAAASLGLGQTGPITSKLRKAALTRLDKLQSERPKEGYRGTSAEILCVDHLGRDTPYLLYFRDQRGGSGLRSRENFRDLAGWLLRGAIRGSYWDSVPGDAAEAIGGMLFETFKNTEDHALTDVTGNVLDVSIRAIKTNHHALSPEQLTRIVGEYAPLANYCRALTAPAGASYAHLFELSVLDSGPGFAATWTGTPLTDLSIDDETTAVRACFGRGSAKRHSRFGEGLPHVLRILRQQRGFLRLRTGRLSLFIDYSDDEHAADGTLRSVEQPDKTAYAPVAGSALTMLIPMRRTS